MGFIKIINLNDLALNFYNFVIQVQGSLNLKKS